MLAEEIGGAHAAAERLLRGRLVRVAMPTDHHAQPQDHQVPAPGGRLPIGFEPHPDGAFDEISSTGDEGASVSIQGRIVGDAIEADVADSVCEHHWHVVRNRLP
jgi:hypothetical protein